MSQLHPSIGEKACRSAQSVLDSFTSEDSVCELYKDVEAHKEVIGACIVGDKEFA